jgi:hypothetical protein
LTFFLGLLTGLALAAIVLRLARNAVYRHAEAVLFAALRQAKPGDRVVALQSLMNQWCPLCGEEVTPQTECGKPHPIRNVPHQPGVN